LLPVGNDIVDLKTPATQDKSSDLRFINRVFTAHEQETIHSSKVANRTLWVLWAAKETAYKLYSKVAGPPVFSHRSFQCAIEKTNEQQSDFSIAVSYENEKIPVEVVTTPEYVHATSARGDAHNYLTDYGIRRLSPKDEERWQDRKAAESIFTELERSAIHNMASALVRYYCKRHLSALAGIAAQQWQIIRPTHEKKPQPPYLLLDGYRTDCDVSLSHHGIWLAWALSLPKNSKVRRLMSSDVRKAL